LQQLLYLIYFALEPDNPIVCIEEPETHLHARMQYGLALLFRTVPNKQFFISTHSNIFLRQTIADRVFILKMDDRVQVEDGTNRATVLTDLGYDVADNLVSDVLVLLEGPTDVPVLEVLLRKKGTLPKYRVSFWPIGGDNMARLNLTPIVEKANVLALVDNDPGSEKARQRFMEECERVGVEVMRLQGRAIENYFTVSALRQVFGTQIPSELSVLDLSTSVKDQIGLDPKAKNWNVASEMSIDDIAGTDLAVFLDKVTTRAESKGA
jgi:predicted ATP-dependent endonuclease of OLD family